MLQLIALTTLITTATVSAKDTPLCRFDGKGPTLKWVQKNDPVMGGKSTGTFTVANNTGIFDGDVVDVPFLKAPGFIKADTYGSSYPDASACSGIYLNARSSTNYTGYRFSFGTAKAPHGGFFSYGFKTHFDAPLGSKWQRVEMPFNEFSDAWNDATGNLDHTCAENKIYCPSVQQLKNFQTMSIW
jgi:hypothetical protein